MALRGRDFAVMELTMLTPVYNLYSPKCRVEIKDLFCSLIWKSTNFPGLFFFAKWSKRLGPFSGLLMSAGAVSAIKTSPLQENKICFPLFTTRVYAVKAISEAKTNAHGKQLYLLTITTFGIDICWGWFRVLKLTCNSSVENSEMLSKEFLLRSF